MNKTSRKRRISNTLLTVIGIVALLILSLLFLWAGQRESIQAKPPVIAGVSLVGEYRIGDGEWNPIVKGKHIPSTRGDVTIRGVFWLNHPTSDTPATSLFEGATVQLYFNHIGGYAILSDGTLHTFEIEDENLGEEACAAAWGALTIPDGEPITFVLQNPHVYGNENAIDEFLRNISIAPGIHHESMMLAKGSSQRTTGLVIFIAALLILGIAVFSTLTHIKQSEKMWLIGLASASAGGYLIFSSFAVNLWNDPRITNTRMLGLSMMLYMLFFTMLVVTLLEGRIKKAASVATLLSAVTMVCCMAVACTDRIKFYDTWLWWAAAETVLALLLILCLALSFKGSSLTDKLFYATCMLILAAFCLDFLATAIGWWTGGLVSRTVFFAVFILGLAVVLRTIPANINAAIKAHELEAEQQALKLELQENRISIMLSQMQPHFIFNTLNTIYHLCEINPDKARDTIRSFSDYLRNNIDNLARSEMIFIEKELSFVKTYLDIEKVRFDDELLISFDIRATNFKIPVLTVEPIVENAVKHGTSKREGVSSLFISTRETDTHYEIEIRDTGVGFDPNRVNESDDGHKHIGISSVRQRLAVLCDGTLTIESHIGEGTTATIHIPKKEMAKT